MFSKLLKTFLALVMAVTLWLILGVILLAIGMMFEIKHLNATTANIASVIVAANFLRSLFRKIWD